MRAVGMQAALENGMSGYQSRYEVKSAKRFDIGDYMKKQLLSFVALGLLFMTASAYAQTIKVKANIPFDFVVDKRPMPKGEYNVDTFGSQGSNFLLIQSADGSAKKIEGGHACESALGATESKMVFHKYGNQYFLTQVWSANAGSGYEFQPGKLEKELASASTASNVVVAGLR